MEGDASTGSSLRAFTHPIVSRSFVAQVYGRVLVHTHWCYAPGLSEFTCSFTRAVGHLKDPLPTHNQWFITSHSHSFPVRMWATQTVSLPHACQRAVRRQARNSPLVFYSLKRAMRLIEPGYQLLDQWFNQVNVEICRGLVAAWILKPEISKHIDRCNLLLLL